MNHQVIRVVFGLAFGIALALYAYDRVTDPLPRQQRTQEEEVVSQARGIVKSWVAPTSDLEFVDPLTPIRKIGKTYIYPTDSGWRDKRCLAGQFIDAIFSAGCLPSVFRAFARLQDVRVF